MGSEQVRVVGRGRGEAFVGALVVRVGDWVTLGDFLEMADGAIEYKGDEVLMLVFVLGGWNEDEMSSYLAVPDHKARTSTLFGLSTTVARSLLSAVEGAERVEGIVSGFLGE